MRFFVLFFIRFYWIIPKCYRNRCIFKEPCSKYVYRITKEDGFRAGIIAFKYRFQKCRQGFYKLNEDYSRLADDSIIDNKYLNIQ
jgi:putative component of membrane protein insertase Oxa1/YidC/SpoIIIJ protein YidD